MKYLSRTDNFLDSLMLKRPQSNIPKKNKTDAQERKFTRKFMIMAPRKMFPPEANASQNAKRYIITIAARGEGRMADISTSTKCFRSIILPYSLTMDSRMSWCACENP